MTAKPTMHILQRPAQAYGVRKVSQHDTAFTSSGMALGLLQPYHGGFVVGDNKTSMAHDHMYADAMLSLRGNDLQQCMSLQ